MKDPEKKPEAGPEEIVAALENVAKAARLLTESRLKTDVIAFLISRSMRAKDRVSSDGVLNVLEAAARLDITCLKPLPPKKGPQS